MSELGFLLDTHVLIWWTDGDVRLAKKHLRAIESEAPVFVSSVSVFEIVVKRSLGKLETGDDPIRKAATGNTRELPVTWKHARAVEALPFHHRDPFDRLLIAQASTEGLTLLTSDAAILQYDIATL